MCGVPFNIVHYFTYNAKIKGQPAFWLSGLNDLLGFLFLQKLPRLQYLFQKL